MLRLLRGSSTTGRRARGRRIAGWTGIGIPCETGTTGARAIGAAVPSPERAGWRHGTTAATTTEGIGEGRPSSFRPHALAQFCDLVHRLLADLPEALGLHGPALAVVQDN